MRCETCRFYGNAGDLPGHHPHCRLNPPISVNSTSSYYPLVLPRWFCSRHTFSLIAWLKAFARRFKRA
jgi:hypothetical protein